MALSLLYVSLPVNETGGTPTPRNGDNVKRGKAVDDDVILRQNRSIVLNRMVLSGPLGYCTARGFGWLWRLAPWREVLTELLRYPVLAISSEGIDCYPTEQDLATCHRRSVKSSYRNLRLIDSDRDYVEVEAVRIRQLPPRSSATGGLSRDLVWVELDLSEPRRLSMNEVRDLVVQTLGEGAEHLEDILAAKGIRELCGLLAEA